MENNDILSIHTYVHLHEKKLTIRTYLRKFLPIGAFVNGDLRTCYSIYKKIINGHFHLSQIGEGI